MSTYSLILNEPIRRPSVSKPPRVCFDMSTSTLKQARGFCVFFVTYNTSRVVDEFGHEMVFATHEAAETKADELAESMNTDRNCFGVERLWL